MAPDRRRRERRTILPRAHPIGTRARSTEWASLVRDRGTTYDFINGATASEWHTYGMIWSKNSVSYYVDNPSQPYVSCQEHCPLALNPTASIARLKRRSATAYLKGELKA